MRCCCFHLIGQSCETAPFNFAGSRISLGQTDRNRHDPICFCRCARGAWPWPRCQLAARNLSAGVRLSSAFPTASRNAAVLMLAGNSPPDEKGNYRSGTTVFFADRAEIEPGFAAKKTSTTIPPDRRCNRRRSSRNRAVERATSVTLPRASGASALDHPYRKAVLASIGRSSNLCPYEDHPFPPIF